MGRKRIIIDWNRVDRMLEAGCTGVEIAAALAIDDNTLFRACKRDNKIDFGNYSRQKRESGKTLLRQAQFKSAMDGNVTMQIWLGKQRLGQSEKTHAEHNVSADLINGISAMLNRARDEFEN